MKPPKTRNENIVVQEMDNEILIYDFKNNKAFCLNETSAIIYQLCDGKNSVADIAQKFSKQSNQSISDELIWLALDGLKKENLLENNEIEIDFNGLSRRQVIRKIGFASMIALPMISSIVAPSSAHAQSGANLPLFATCSNSSQCASGFCFSNTKCCVPGSVNGFNPGQGNSPSVFPGDCPSLSQSQRNDLCNSVLSTTSCCAGNGWVASSCSTFTPIANRVLIVCNCA